MTLPRRQTSEMACCFYWSCMLFFICFSTKWKSSWKCSFVGCSVFNFCWNTSRKSLTRKTSLGSLATWWWLIWTTLCGNIDHGADALMFSKKVLPIKSRRGFANLLLMILHLSLRNWHCFSFKIRYQLMYVHIRSSGELMFFFVLPPMKTYYFL